MTEKKILVIGAGAWGSAIANLLAKNNNQANLLAKNNFTVCLVANKSEVVDEINDFHSNKSFLQRTHLLRV
jgi:glycerol-3-phosphate dehydrogenase (NAD(P)+)